VDFKGPKLPTVRLAAAQIAPVFLDRDRTVEKACEAIREAGRNGADLVAFSEGFIPGHPLWYYYFPATSPESLEFAERLFNNSVEIPGPTVDALCEASQAANVNVVIGVCQRLPGTTGTMWNSQLFISRSAGILGVHQKLVPTVSERLVHALGSGRGMRAFPMDIGPVGGLICGENSNPLAIHRLLSQQMRVCVSSWPYSTFPAWDGPNISDIGMMVGRSAAYMAKCFLINACGTLTPDVANMMTRTEGERAQLINNLGGSTIISPTGKVLAGPAGRGEEIIYADVDLEEIVRNKLVHDFAGHYQRMDVFSFATHGSDPNLVTDMEPDSSYAVLDAAVDWDLPVASS
jgi:aliphatic nitrilase